MRLLLASEINVQVSRRIFTKQVFDIVLITLIFWLHIHIFKRVYGPATDLTWE
jgi:hypothetical protein